MADVDNGDIIRLGAGLSFQGVYDIVNVWHILAETGTGASWAVATTAIQGYLDTLYDEIKAVLSDTVGTNVISVVNVSQVTTLGSIAWSPTWAGTEGGECTPPGVNCFTWARTYKPRVQIRKYLGVFGEANLAAGVWSAAIQTACKAMMTYHVAPHLISGGLTFTGIAYNRTLATHELGVSVDASGEPSYQRRRKRGRGS